MKRAIIIIICLSLFGLYRLDRLNQIPVHPDNYSTYNLVEIYVLGLVMSVLAYPMYPEIAIEHLALYSKYKGERESDFFMRSSVVQSAIKNYTRPNVLSWNARHYMIGDDEARVSLALNGATLIKYNDKIVVKVPVKYPRNSLVSLAPGIKVQEGLFWVLQQKGWYHTGTMTWVHHL